MSLESEISELRSEINQFRSESARMEREIAQMTSSIERAKNGVASAQSQSVGALQKGVQVIGTDDDVLKNVSAVGKDIEQRMRLYKNMEDAYKNIRSLRNELRYQQGNEKNVRRMVAAIIDNEEMSLASEETLRTQAEKLHLETQGFFLSFVMMELELRKNGETAAADRALAQAEKMDPRKTAWVYYMIALRRNDAAARALWLKKIMKNPMIGAEKEYLKILTLLSLKEESEESDKIKSYIGLDTLDDIDSDAVVKKILKDYMASVSLKPPRFKNIDECVRESDDLQGALLGAMNNESVFAHVQRLTSNADKMRNDVILKMFDTVIESCHSPKAMQIYKEIDYQEKIIQAKGVLEDAVALQAQEDVMESSDVDLKECLYEWLNIAEQYNGKRELNELSYTKYKPSYKRAYSLYVESYHELYKEEVTLTIGEYSDKTKLKDVSQEEAKIDTFCRVRCAAEKSRIKDTKFILFTVFGALLLVAGIVLGCLKSVLGSGLSVALLFICAIAGIALLLCGAREKYANYKAKIAADEKCARDVVLYTQKLREVFADMERYREMYAEFDAKVVPLEAF